jgi:hypothetical protein
MLSGDVNALPHPRTNNGSLVSCLNKKLCRSLHLSPTHPNNFEFFYSSPSDDALFFEYVVPSDTLLEGQMQGGD